MKKLFALAASLMVILTGCSVSPSPEPVSNPTRIAVYETCSELNLDYLGGVSRVGAVNDGPLPVAEWVEDEELYELVSVLDDDGDGIACELLKLTQELKAKWYPEVETETSYLATQSITFGVDSRYTENAPCSSSYSWQVLGKDSRGNLAYLRCRSGTFHVDDSLFRFDPETNAPLIPAEVTGYQSLAYAPHSYIIPRITADMPDGEVSDSVLFEDVSPCRIRDFGIAPDKRFGFDKTIPNVVELKGEVRLLVLPVQFSDFPSDSRPRDDIADVLFELTNYYERMASTDVSFLWEIPDNYRMMPKALKDYELSSEGLGGNFRNYYEPYIQDVIDLWDEDYDFSQFDVVVIEETRSVPNDLHPHYLPIVQGTGNGGWNITSDDPNSLGALLVTGNDETRNIPNWMHEFGHLLGMPDRNYDSGEPGFDIMFGWYGSPEMSIWLRWAFGIATDSQIRCVTTSDPSTHLIQPVAWDGEYVKGVVIPVDDSTVLVAESRKRQGYDVLTAKFGEGVYVYRIDTKAKMYGEDSRTLVDSIRPDRATVLQTDWSFDSQLQPGDSVTSDGWQITSLESGDFGELIRVERVN